MIGVLEGRHDLNRMAGQSSQDRMALDFIDPLFAVVVSIGLVTVMAQPWFEGRGSLTMAFAFDIGVLVLGGSTVILSWVGYHKSISTKPIRLETTPGFWRFIGDILLLLLYWLLLVKFQNFWFVLLTLVMIHIVFIGWDWLKKLEWDKNENDDAKLRRGVTVFWTLVYMVLFLVYWQGSWNDGQVTFADWFLLGLAGLATGLYRVHKSKLSLSWLLSRIAPC